MTMVVGLDILTEVWNVSSKYAYNMLIWQNKCL